MMEFHDGVWARKGATLSDKTARSEYGLTQDEIFAAIDAGKLQYRPAAMHGNPWLRLLRREVEDLDAGHPSQARLLRQAAVTAIKQLIDAVGLLNERRSGRTDRSADFRVLAPVVR